MSDYETAKEVQALIESSFQGEEIAGTGIENTDDGYGIVILLERESATIFPAELEGVPIRTRVLGRIFLQ